MNVYLDMDIATENGDLELVKELYKKYSVKPSLYAKQICSINGYHNVVIYIENYIGTRNNVSIEHVHKKYNRFTKQFEWDEIVPNTYRY